jgi:acetyl esterase/lipase
MFVSGHSAGGHLAALLATDEKYLKAHKLGLNNIKGVVPISGVFLISTRLSKIFGDEEACKAASPMTHVRAKLPPMLILYADKEIAGLGKQAEAFGEALTKAKSEAKVVMIEDRNHGSIMGNIAQPTDPATKLIFEFINKHAGTKIEPVAPPKKETR